MKKTYLLLTIAMILSACGGKKASSDSDAAKVDSVAAAQDSVATEAPAEDDKEAAQFYEQLDFGKFVDLLKTPSKEKAEKCGLSFIYEAESDVALEGDAAGTSEVYGWGIEKGKKNEFGYALNSTSPHACYFYYQADTSQQAAMCFKSKADADRFMEKALAYGIVDMNGDYHIAEEKLPNGTVKVDSFSDYTILTSMEKPVLDNEYHKGFYVIRFYYFA